MTPYDITSVQAWSRQDLERIFFIADHLEEAVPRVTTHLRQKIMAYLFLQPSTRTRLSMMSAFIKVGGHCVGFSNTEEGRMGPSYRESLEDTGRVLSHYSDIILCRAKDKGELEDLISGASVPVISGGHAREEHPTQALLDLYTLRLLKSKIDNLCILIAGNLDNRCVKSLLLGLSRYHNIHPVFISPKGLGFSEEWHKRVMTIYPNAKFYSSYASFFSGESPRKIDAIYLDDYDEPGLSIGEAEEKYRDFTMNLDKLSKFRDDVFILNALPRMLIDKEVDETQNAQYFFQAKVGFSARVAMFIWMFERIRGKPYFI